MLNAKPTPREDDDNEAGAQEPEFKPLTRDEARQWRARQPVLSLWRLVGVQWLVGLLAAVLAYLFTQSVPVAVSVLYGAACVALPSTLMVYGLTSSALSRLLSGFAQAAWVGFLFWEGVKILLSVAMLAATVWVLPEANWIGLLIGLVLVLKVYWFGVLLQARRPLANG